MSYKTRGKLGTTRTRTRINNSINQPLGLQPLIQTPKQAEYDAVVTEVGFAQIIQERRGGEKELNGCLRILRLEAWGD